jgi:hypothetical protein
MFISHLLLDGRYAAIAADAAGQFARFAGLLDWLEP